MKRTILALLLLAAWSETLRAEEPPAPAAEAAPAQ